MAAIRTGSAINFQNHCLICLEPESPAVMMDLLKNNPNLLRTFQPVLHYLSGTDPTYTKSQLECKLKGLPVMVNLPPLCVNCYDLTSSIYRLHAELLQCQVEIQRKTEEVRKIVGSTKKFVLPPSIVRRTRRNLFLYRLRSSGLMSDGEVDGMRRFVKRLHSTIIEQGSNKVIFPSEPPPNFIPLPPRILPPLESLGSPTQPLGLLQLPPSSPPVQGEHFEEVPSPPPVTTTTPSFSPPRSPLPPCSPGPIIVSVASKAVVPELEPAPPQPSEVTPEILPLEKPVTPFPTTTDIDIDTTTALPSDIIMLPFPSQLQLEFEKENDKNNPVQVDKEIISIDNFPKPPSPPPLNVILKEQPHHERPPSKVVEDNIDKKETIIPKKKRKIHVIQPSPQLPAAPPQLPPPPLQSHLPPSQLPAPRQIPPSLPPPKSPSLENPSQIFPAPLLQLQAAEILLQLSVSFIQKPPPPPPPPSKPPPEKPSLPSLPPQFNKKLPCEICNEYRPLNHIKPHLLAVHSGIQGHSCPICHKIFISTSRLIHHWEIRKKKCGKDPLVFKKLENFYTCLNCPSPKKLQNLAQMSTHIFSSHERDNKLTKCYTCGICNLKFRTKLGLDFHLNLHTHLSRRLKEESKFRAICPPDPDWRRKKKRKFFEKPNFNNLKAPCDQCQLNYNCRDLEKHLVDSHGYLKDDLEKCRICPYRSTKLESLKKHLKICHKKEMSNGKMTPTPPVTSIESQLVEN